MAGDYPIEDCVASAEQLTRQYPQATIHQKWTCQFCKSRQTMEAADKFFRSGLCEECKQTTIIKRCNYVAIIPARKQP